MHGLTFLRIHTVVKKKKKHIESLIVMPVLEDVYTCQSPRNGQLQCEVDQRLKKPKIENRGMTGVKKGQQVEK